MPASSLSHPPDGVLVALAAAQLDEDAAETVFAHLETCVECRARMGGLSGGNFLRRLRAAHGGDAAAVTSQPAVGGARPTMKAEPAATTSSKAPAIPPALRGHEHYEVIHELGRGGMGVVYLARNRLMGRLEVLKVVHKELLDDAETVARFLREIRSAAQLNHPNIVTAYAALPLGDLLVLAMEYVEGEDLARVVRARGPLPVVNACHYVRQAALGLQHAFEKGMVHRDVKPENLILARDGKKHVVKVLDFGLAKATQAKEEASRKRTAGDGKLTKVGMMLGTADYIAPEQILDAAHADVRADVYSLGCTLYFLLAGGPPFQEKDVDDLLQAHCTREAKRLDAVREEVQAELASVVARMMAKDPARRYQEPIEVAQALAPFVGATLRPLPPASAAAGDAEAADPNAATVGGKPAVRWDEGPDTVALAAAPPRRGTSRKSEPGVSATGESAPRDAPRPWRRLRILLGVGGVLVLLAALGLWAGSVVRVKTPQGILVVEVNEPNAEVFVDGDTITVTWGKDGKTAEVRLKPGTHKVEVRKDGFRTIGEEVDLQEGKVRILTARLEATGAPARRPGEGPAKEAPRESPEKGREGRPKKVQEEEQVEVPRKPRRAVQEEEVPRRKVLPPSKERVEAGFYFSDPVDMPSILVQKDAEDGKDWRRLNPGARVYTSDRLVSLPGYTSEVRLDSGVRLTLRGHLPEFSDPKQRWMDFLLESAVVLHQNKDFDADLTLDRGRLYIANYKETGAARVRLRFGKEDDRVWDLTLEEPGTEIGVDLLKQYTPRENYLEGEEPRMELYLLVLKGKASVRIGAEHYANLPGAPQPSVFAWDNKGAGARGPGREAMVPTFWFKALPQGREADAMVLALKELARKMVDVKRPPSLVLEEFLQESDVPKRLANRLLAIYSYCALDDVRRLIATLGDTDTAHVPERDTAIFVLRRWISRDAANSTLLYDAKNKRGLLTATQKYRPGEAQIIATLLHDFNDEARQSRETYETLAEYLASDQVAIAELAIWHLRRLGLGTVKLPRFNAAFPKEGKDGREAAAAEVRKWIEDGKLPSPPPAPMK